MSALAQARRDLARVPASLAAGESGLLVQRRSTLESAAPVVAPPIVEAGRPLDAGTRAAMEPGFGRSFEHVRVHDDARAHDAARMLDARAYTAGNDVVFAEGAYRPGTPAGEALIAHELAHTVQQGGVQMKAAGPMPASADRELEAQADQASAAVLAGRSAPALTVVTPRIQRAPAAEAAPAPPANVQTQPPAADMPDGMVAVKDEAADAKTLIVQIADYQLPESKGKGEWVQQAYTEAGGGGTTGRLVFSPLMTGKSIAAYKEDDGAPYKEIWLGKAGFRTTGQLAEAFDGLVAGPDEAKGAKAVKAAAKEPGVSALIAGMHKNLQDSGCDIDHIVEKQMGGTSIASNLQLLTAKVNQTSGVANYNKLVEQVQRLREPGMRGEKATKFQLRIEKATVTPGPADASYHVEKLMRDGDLSGDDAVKKKVVGSPVRLEAGGQGEDVTAHDSKATAIPAMAKRLVPSVRLTRYQRGQGGRASKSDQVFGRFDSKAMETHGDDAGDGKIVFAAVPSDTPGAVTAASAGTPAAAADTAPAGPSGEIRALRLAANANTNIKFYYPYLSPGNITKLDMDAAGNLRTAPSMPGIKDGKGTIVYRSDTGWTGSLTATGSPLSGATASIRLGFAEAKNGMAVTADGKLTMPMRGSLLELEAKWMGSGLHLSGGVTVKKPLPMVDEVDLRGSYGNGLLALSAKPKVHWKAGSVDLNGDADVKYLRKDGDTEGRFSGSVTFAVKNEKMDGKLTVALSEAGKPTGKGELSYQLTKSMRPKLGIELEPSGKVKLSGQVKVADIPLTEAWPKPPEDRKRILKASVAADIPTPIPALSVSLRVSGELGVFYSVGPMALRGLTVDASLYPFEDDKQVKAHLSGAFVIPAKGGLYGRFGVLIGASVGYGAVGAEGGLYVVPEVGVKGEGGVKIEADYSDEGFSFEGEAYAKGAMYGSLGIEFAVDVSALWGLVDHEWTFPVAKWGPKQLGPELNITLGKVGYSKDGKITWPSLSQIDVNPKDFDPMNLLKSVLADSTGS